MSQKIVGVTVQQGVFEGTPYHNVKFQCTEPFEIGKGAGLKVEAIKVMCLIVVGVLKHLHDKWTPTACDPQKQSYVTEVMLHILSAVYEQICVYRPIDAFSIIETPIQRGNKWIYRVKCTLKPNALVDQGSLRDYVALINRRAADIKANLRVTNVHLSGQFIVFDVEITR